MSQLDEFMPVVDDDVIPRHVSDIEDTVNSAVLGMDHDARTRREEFGPEGGKVLLSQA